MRYPNTVNLLTYINIKCEILSEARGGRRMVLINERIASYYYTPTVLRHAPGLKYAFYNATISS